MGRIWATLGNLYRISAVAFLLFGLFGGYAAIQRLTIVGAGDAGFQFNAIATVGYLVLAFLFWMVKPVLISNRPRIVGPIVRTLVAGSFIVSFVLWIALALAYFRYPGVLEYLLIGFLGQVLFIGIVYALTGEPAAYDYARNAPSPKEPKYRAPSNFQPSGRVGPSGATAYADATRMVLAGHFDSYTPIQVMEESNGFSRVVAGSGQSGWIDSRTVAAL